MSGTPTFDENYQSVAERIHLFRDKYPEGSLTALDPNKPFEIVTVDERSFVAVAAVAMRNPTDPAPGMGLAWCPIPGLDEYTRNSEVMNAQTSAWGRAIIAVLAADAKKIASAEEVRSAQSHRSAPAKKAPAETPSAATANGTSVRPDVAPPSTDPAREDYNAIVVSESVRLLNDPTTTHETLKDIWETLRDARLGGRRIPPPAGMEPDGDGLVPIHSAVAFVGKERKAAAEARTAASAEVASAQPTLTVVEDPPTEDPKPARRTRKAATPNE